MAPVIMLTAIISTVVVSALWMAGLAVFYHAMSGSDPAFAVKIDVPPQTTVGAEILVQMEVTNPTDSSLELDSIDFEDSLLEGFRVKSVFPAPTGTYKVIDSMSYSYSESLSAGETFKISFLLEAVKPGIWTGDVDFCNPSQDFVTSSATVRVDVPGTVASVTGSADVADRDPPFVLEITTPHAVTVGEKFTLRATVTNPTDSSLVLDCIDFDETLSKGFEFQNIEPAPKEKLLDDGDPSLVWAKSLAPGGSFTALIEMRAINTGIWTGDLSFWDEKSEGYVSSSVTIRVRPAPAAMSEAVGSQPVENARNPD